MLIGIAGKSGSGKSLAALLLSEHVIEEREFKIKSFATKVKKIVGILTNQTVDEINEMKDSKPTMFNGKFTNRQLLQIIGTDLFRNKFYPHVWADALLHNYHHSWDWIIDDVRFENEITTIKSFGGIVIYLNRTNCNKMIHESENSLPDPELYPAYYDYVIKNNESKTDLLKNLLYIYDIEKLKI